MIDYDKLFDILERDYGNLKKITVNQLEKAINEAIDKGYVVLIPGRFKDQNS